MFVTRSWRCVLNCGERSSVEPALYRLNAIGSAPKPKSPRSNFLLGKPNFNLNLKIQQSTPVKVLVHTQCDISFRIYGGPPPSAWIVPPRVRSSNVAWSQDSICSRCRLQQRRQFTQSRQLTDSLSVVDHPAKLVRVNQKHGPGLIILALIPIISFGLGCWQVQRLDWKTKLIAKFEDRLVRPPLPLPPRVDPDAISEFDYRRVYATGHYNHEKEMLVGPRMREGEDGFIVVTPLERGDDQSTVLVNRGWISRKHMAQKDRPEGLPRGEVTVEGLLREPWQKNMFTPENKPAEGKFYFPDIVQMAELSGSQPVWIESTMTPDLLQFMACEAKGIPIGRAPEVNLRNNHAQYIFTWFGLSFATSVMMWMLVRKKPNEALRRVRQNRNW